MAVLSHPYPGKEALIWCQQANKHLVWQYSRRARPQTATKTQSSPVPSQPLFPPTVPPPPSSGTCSPGQPGRFHIGSGGWPAPVSCPLLFSALCPPCLSVCLSVCLSAPVFFRCRPLCFAALHARHPARRLAACLAFASTSPPLALPTGPFGPFGPSRAGSSCWIPLPRPHSSNAPLCSHGDTRIRPQQGRRQDCVQDAEQPPVGPTGGPSPSPLPPRIAPRRQGLRLCLDRAGCGGTRTCIRVRVFLRCSCSTEMQTDQAEEAGGPERRVFGRMRRRVFAGQKSTRRANVQYEPPSPALNTMHHGTGDDPPVPESACLALFVVAQDLRRSARGRQRLAARGAVRETRSERLCARREIQNTKKKKHQASLQFGVPWPRLPVQDQARPAAC